ncbi:MAG: bifunctional phosphopantothenoylcysteine decarboxylase/phosphopantothenate--cysteine ligase CoaBC [Muribaculaceae bacterium]|nr:bifunctional phosphopantothenoylcysteine decarboxylase/phosphopantothenate--cysteine ligase CoaBC [Muribaculaceae bacterium]
MSSLKGKHIVLGITGGIAAYKSAMLLRLLIKRGAEVQVVMTPAAKEFITPVTLSALSGKPVVSEFFTANTGEWHSHVDLGLWADLMIVAPATASTLGKMANGIADNMLVTTYLSAKEHVMVAPAMDLDMYASSSTRRNLATLASDGVEIIEAAEGELASHLVGKGRMAEPEEIVARVDRFFSRSGEMSGMKVALTLGPTYEKLDPVRFIGNYSSGKMGCAIAEECASRGAEVTAICGPVSVYPSHPNIRVVKVESAAEMHAEAMKEFPLCDIGILTAAVADFRPETCAGHKIKRENDEEMTIRLVRNPDIAAGVGAKKKEGQTLVGFALETDNAFANAERKLERKNLDMIVLNSLADKGAGFRTDTNKVTIFSRGGGKREYPLKSKREVAADIADAIVEYREKRQTDLE